MRKLQTASDWFATLDPADYRKFAKRRDLDVLSDGPNDEDEEDEDDEDEEEEENRDDDLEKSIAAVTTASPSISREQAAAWLIHTAHGRATHAALRKQQSKETKMPEIDILKLHNVNSVVEIAKNLNVGDEHGFTKILMGHAQATGTSLEKVLSAQTPEGSALREQYARISGMHPNEMRR